MLLLCLQHPSWSKNMRKNTQVYTTKLQVPPTAPANQQLGMHMLKQSAFHEKTTNSESDDEAWEDVFLACPLTNFTVCTPPRHHASPTTISLYLQEGALPLEKKLVLTIGLPSFSNVRRQGSSEI